LLVACMAVVAHAAICTQTDPWSINGVTQTVNTEAIEGWAVCGFPTATLDSVTVGLGGDGTDPIHHSTFSVLYTNPSASTIPNLLNQGNQRIRIFTEPGAADAALTTTSPTLTHLAYTLFAVAPTVDGTAPEAAPTSTFTLTPANFQDECLNACVDYYVPTTFTGTFNFASKTFTPVYSGWSTFLDEEWNYYVKTIHAYTVTSGITSSAVYTATGTTKVDYSYTAAVVGDPQFAGFQGQQFQVHGIPEEHFNLVSTPDFFINSRFVYLSNGFCDYNETECFTHPGTYIDQLSFVMDGAVVKIVAGAHANGLSVSVNSQVLSAGHRVRLPLSNTSFVHVINHREVVVSVDMFEFRILNSDLFLNMHAQLTDNSILTAGAKKVIVNESDPAKVDRVLSTSYPEYLIHGLLGQTWRNVQFQHKRFIQGDATDYQVANLNSPNFVYTTYTKQQSTSA